MLLELVAGVWMGKTIKQRQKENLGSENATEQIERDLNY
jgi:hypothetical protein